MATCIYGIKHVAQRYVFIGGGGGGEEVFYLTMHSTHYIYGYMASVFTDS